MLLIRAVKSINRIQNKSVYIIYVCVYCVYLYVYIMHTYIEEIFTCVYIIFIYSYLHEYLNKYL